jgi:hypothetical protein
VDAGNLNRSDIAFVFTDAIARSGISDVADYVDQVAALIAHEAGHLIGMAHADVHADAGPLANVAFDPKVHVAIGKDVLADLNDDDKVTINGTAYTVHPKIVHALKTWESYYNAGCVAGDGFPDALMGQFLVHAEENATWLTRLLDMAWQAQGDAKYTPDEQSQILAFTYGYLTHSTGDLWAHTLVNDFAEGTAPGFIAGAVSLPKGSARPREHAAPPHDRGVHRQRAGGRGQEQESHGDDAGRRRHRRYDPGHPVRRADPLHLRRVHPRVPGRSGADPRA